MTLNTNCSIVELIRELDEQQVTKNTAASELCQNHLQICLAELKYNKHICNLVQYTCIIYICFTQRKNNHCCNKVFISQAVANCGSLDREQSR